MNQINPQAQPEPPHSEPLLKTSRSKVRRVPKRGHYDRQQVYQILDEGLVCHVGFVVDGQPFVIPTAYGRVEDQFYIHGSPASRMLRNLQQGIPVCITVTLIDGLVLARSAFHHSMNYRSVVLFGTATPVLEPDLKLAALKAFTENIIPGRWNDIRLPSRQEMAATLVLALPIAEASAKVRTGPPKDDEADYALPIWAGEIPLRHSPAPAIPDPVLSDDIAIPAYVAGYNPVGDAM
ncbi:pyridoxamine 5'-phosphate oxidase family protein [Romeria aff. gracilis LEGE 07310]|uniref:Pyridoxamine 5'-phosphate oxidase family protein n=1 Tax=Vasconcelosia minhoensis LEGE 07310 TaxID=915328 RepID=A0A8J7A872_9CYAN|nr:pyridoxamine 5'-phosphate oxidase family protein [Romeria gracilis]MBE9077875.1 pyridoxamine 5'-phosphate oxidase family protein [Romeria aff. gracilis LEGE 07310]